MTQEIAAALFDLQVKTLITKGYPELIGISVAEFMLHIEPLKEKLSHLSLQKDPEDGFLPFVLVIKSDFMTPEQAFSLIDYAGKPGIINLDPLTPEDFTPIEAVTIPHGMAYLLINIDRGKETMNVAPKDALQTITKQQRSPLTIDEGIAIMTQFPDFLQKNNCFSLLASRAGDKRVPAIWISEERPKLGWCWDGNPHTWLGSASCAERIGS